MNEKWRECMREFIFNFWNFSCMTVRKKKMTPKNIFVTTSTNLVFDITFSSLLFTSSNLPVLKINRSDFYFWEMREKRHRHMKPVTSSNQNANYIEIRFLTPTNGQFISLSTNLLRCYLDIFGDKNSTSRFNVIDLTWHDTHKTEQEKGRMNNSCSKVI